jgi:hypothetical protein
MVVVDRSNCYNIFIEKTVRDGGFHEHRPPVKKDILCTRSHFHNRSFHNGVSAAPRNSRGDVFDSAVITTPAERVPIRFG